MERHEEKLKPRRMRSDDRAGMGRYGPTTEAELKTGAGEKAPADRGAAMRKTVLSGPQTLVRKKRMVSFNPWAKET